MVPLVPFDITMDILDQAADNPQSLCNLALTCRDFLPRSRYHLLAWHVFLRSPKMVHDFCHHLDANSHLRPFVRHVTLCTRSKLMNKKPIGRWTEALSSIIPTHLLKLPNLRHWKLEYFRDIGLSSCVDHLQLDCLQGNSTSITALVLHEVIFLDLTEFVLFLCAFPGLSSLKVSWLDYKTDGTEVAKFMLARDRLARQLHLTSLDIGYGVKRSLTTLLMEIGQSTIEDLAFPLSRREAPDQGRVRALVLGMSALRSVTISQPYCPEMTLFITDVWELIKGLPSSPPRSYTIIVNFLGDPHFALSKEPLVDTNRELEQSLIRQQSHSIVFRGCDTKLCRETFWTTILSRHFPELHRQGRLTIEGDKSNDTYYMAGHDDAVWCLAVSPDSKWVASGSSDGTIIVWNAQHGNIILQWVAHEGAVRDLAFSPSSCFLMSGGQDHLVIIWDAERGGAQIATLGGHDREAVVCAWSPDGTLLASGYEDGTVRVWDAKLFVQLHCFSFRNAGGANGPFVQFSPDGRWLAFKEENNCCSIWSTANRRSHKTVYADEELLGRAAFDPSSNRIAIAAKDSTVHIWDVETAEELLVLREHEYTVWDVSFSPSGDWVLSTSHDKTAKIWDSHTGDMIFSLEGHTGYLNAACFSPDGKYVASGSDDGTVRLWRAGDGSCVRTFMGHTDWVRCVLFSAHGETLCSGAGDGTVVIRHLRGGIVL